MQVGRHLLLREGSTERNLTTLAPLVTAQNAANCSFATDDKLPGDLVREGHIDHSIRTAIRCGARETACVYRRDEENMPCSRHEYQNAVEEGARFVFQAAPCAVLGNDRRQVTGLRLIRTELGLPAGTI